MQAIYCGRAHLCHKYCTNLPSFHALQLLTKVGAMTYLLYFDITSIIHVILSNSSLKSSSCDIVLYKDLSIFFNTYDTATAMRWQLYMIEQFSPP